MSLKIILIDNRFLQIYFDHYLLFRLFGVEYYNKLITEKYFKIGKYE
jgi:hypothetical protein